eukprot:CAMPEP_0115063990 /NCGR_PEP_ID=MMETSP0227-20121206/9421_1 /TAXON_ID=89957 /ORGANISM="Polarella glacialis, Strain CCMP 1383" /LENGTH=315 /DNA_ID=CAMNT_0002449567 /DNA_START=53 /DNA_END=1000 /DNA_ORIENTATION=-
MAGEPVRNGRLSLSDLYGSMPISPCWTTVVFDFVFFLNYLLAWIVTLATQPAFVYDNNVVRVFKSFNLCIGVDSWPGRLVAVVIWALGSPLLFLASSLHVYKAKNDSGGYKALRCFLLIAGAVIVNCFALTYAVPPDDWLKTMVHTGAFASGLFGYGVYKLALALEFFVEYKDLLRLDLKAKIYAGTVLFHTCVLFGASAFLVYLLLLKDYRPIIANIRADVIPAVVSGGLKVVGSWRGSFPFMWPEAYVVELDGSHSPVGGDPCGVFLVVVTFLAPIVEALTAPRELVSHGAVVIYTDLELEPDAVETKVLASV